MKSPQEIAAHLDLANHHAGATPEDVKEVCANVLKYGFNGAFVNPCYISLAKATLGDRAKVGTAFSFPLGQDTIEMKLFAAREAIRLGADELDIVPNNGLLLTDNGLGQYRDELRAIVEAVRTERTEAVVKFIIETGLFLADEQTANGDERDRGEFLIKRAAEAILASGADFVKICSGMGKRGASLNDVRLVKEAIGNAPIKIKVAGGIDTIEEAKGFLAAGADRIGTSKAVEIMDQTTLSDQTL
ncbi:deoxyribose-phosphate aldolase [Candidatus Gottesmanbacteria bacterium]|nr:deoxyribose-phosphate aldolase [Candidatus Gottesmanbacteria bacterium]